MKRSIRPSTPADAPAIVALFAELGLNPNARAEDLQWKYWTPRFDSPGHRSYVLTSDDEIVAHAALVPGAILTETRRITTGHVIDWVARRGQGGAGVALMKHIGQQVDCLLAFGGSPDTLRILPHIGFHALGYVTGYARPLFPLRVLDKNVRLSWKLAARLVRNLTWTLMAPATMSGEWRPRAIADHAQISMLSACLPAVANGNAVLERTSGLFHYYLDCTIVRVAIFGMERAGRIGGYFALAFVPGQVRIIDYWVSSDDLSDWQAALNNAVAIARHQSDAAELVLWASNEMQHAVAKACGFHARFKMPVQIRSFAAIPVRAGELNVQMLDNDAAYLHEAAGSHWT